MQQYTGVAVKIPRCLWPVCCSSSLSSWVLLTTPSPLLGLPRCPLGPGNKGLTSDTTEDPTIFRLIDCWCDLYPLFNSLTVPSAWRHYSARGRSGSEQSDGPFVLSSQYRFLPWVTSCTDSWGIQHNWDVLPTALHGGISVNAEFFLASFFLNKIQDQSLPISNSLEEVAISCLFGSLFIRFPSGLVKWMLWFNCLSALVCNPNLSWPTCLKNMGQNGATFPWEETLSCSPSSGSSVCLMWARGEVRKHKQSHSGLSEPALPVSAAQSWEGWRAGKEKKLGGKLRVNVGL